MFPVLLRIGQIEIRSYGIFITMAFLVWILWSIYRARKHHIHPKHIVRLSLLIFFAASGGARLFFLLTHLYQLDGHLELKHELLHLFSSVGVRGISLIGGLAFALIVIWIYSILFSIPSLKLLDTVSPVFGIAIFITRIGCFMNGCCFGTPCKLPWCIKFPITSTAGMHFPDIAIHPVQLYSAIIGLILCIILLWLDRKTHFDGQLFCITGMIYSLSRFLIDYIKYSDSKYTILGINFHSIHQPLFLIMFVISMLLYALLSRKSINHNEKKGS